MSLRPFMPTNALRIMLLAALAMLLAGCPKPVTEINEFAKASESVLDTTSKALQSYEELSVSYSLFRIAKSKDQINSDMFKQSDKLIRPDTSKNKQLANDIAIRLKALAAMKKYAAALDSLAKADKTSDFKKSAESIKSSVNNLQVQAFGKSDPSFSAALGSLAYGVGKVVSEKIRFEGLKISVSAADWPIQVLSKQMQKDSKEFAGAAKIRLDAMCTSNISEYNDIRETNISLEQKIKTLTEAKVSCQTVDKVETFAANVNKAAELFASAHEKIKTDLNAGITDFSNAKKTVDELIATGQEVKEVYDDLIKAKK
ncbi:hypothetical protein [Maridesulfovibrio sp.]|uniref:hypothetical protein n=1 Tax=Maridesulfovibrio sp. TaxID=2795000 RepID=UPI003B001E77